MRSNLAKFIGSGPNFANACDVNLGVRILGLRLLDHLALCLSGDDSALTAVMFRTEATSRTRLDENLGLVQTLFSPSAALSIAGK